MENQIKWNAHQIKKKEYLVQMKYEIADQPDTTDTEKSERSHVNNIANVWNMT